MRLALVLIASTLVGAGTGGARAADGDRAPPPAQAPKKPDPPPRDARKPDRDEEIIAHLDELEHLELLQHLELFDTAGKNAGKK